MNKIKKLTYYTATSGLKHGFIIALKHTHIHRKDNEIIKFVITEFNFQNIADGLFIFDRLD